MFDIEQIQTSKNSDADIHDQDVQGSRATQFLFAAMSSSSIGDPYLLRSYGQPKYNESQSHTSSSPSDPSPCVYVTHGKQSNSEDGYVTVTVQADGIHILDVRISTTSNISYKINCATALFSPSNNITYTWAVDHIFMSSRIPIHSRRRSDYMYHFCCDRVFS